jgi:hypothetical protein
VNCFSEIATLDWHKISVEETLGRLSVSPKTGLESKQVDRNQKFHGKNVISPPKSNMGRKLLEWILGGFGSLLLAASIVCSIAWSVFSLSPLIKYLKNLFQGNRSATPTHRHPTWRSLSSFL